MREIVSIRDGNGYGSLNVTERAYSRVLSWRDDLTGLCADQCQFLQTTAAVLQCRSTVLSLPCLSSCSDCFLFRRRAIGS